MSLTVFLSLSLLFHSIARWFPRPLISLASVIMEARFLTLHSLSLSLASVISVSQQIVGYMEEDPHTLRASGEGR